MVLRKELDQEADKLKKDEDQVYSENGSWQLL
jgi:hypothetical protein